MKPKISIIIPLERSRGLALRCIDGWSNQQSISRAELVELIVVGNTELNKKDEVVLKKYLHPEDQLIFVEAINDVGQDKAGAELANGEWLFFTEAHCIPFPDSLAIIFQIIEDHPEWSGFSGKTTAILEKRFASIEAQFYSGDGKEASHSNSWRKVMNQCFAIQKKVYVEVGGFLAEYGYFAERLLSAQLHSAGFEIGFEPKLILQHKYTGSLKEVEMFTRNFCAGEMDYQKERNNSSFREYICPLYEWENRQDFYERSYKQAMVFCLHSFKIRLLFKYFKQFFLETKWPLLKSRLFIEKERFKLLLGIYFLDEKKLLLMYQCLFSEVIHHERLRKAADEVNSEQFLPEEFLDAYIPEKSEGQVFRWFKPVVLLRYALVPGKYTLKINVLPIVSEEHLKKSCFYRNGCQLNASIDWEKKSIIVVFEVASHSDLTEIGFMTPELHFSEDTRMLGLPVIDIQIEPELLLKL